MSKKSEPLTIPEVINVMTEKNNELLSALMDDEITEFELHRLLKDEPDLESFHNQQLVRDGLHGKLSSMSHIDLSSTISAEIDAIEFDSQSTSKSKWLWLSSGAIAAGILGVAVMLPSFQTPGTTDVQPMALMDATPSAALAVNSEVELENPEESLEFYLATHSGESSALSQAKVQSFARLASFEE